MTTMTAQLDYDRIVENLWKTALTLLRINNTKKTIKCCLIAYEVVGRGCMQL